MEMNYNDAELHRVEEELHVEILPGTEVGFPPLPALTNSG